MSSPLSSLRKPHKSPLPMFGIPSTGLSQRPIPFRNTNYSDDESNLVEEITGNMAASRLKTRDPFSGGLPKLREQTKASTNSSPRSSSSSGPSDHELMTLMMTRVGHLEQKVQYQAKEITEKDRRIRIMEDKLKILQKAREEEGSNKALELGRKCLGLQHQVHEMEAFLADYGMVWIGPDENKSDTYISDTLDDEDSEEEVWRPDTSVSNAGGFKVDFNLVIENIKDLNVLAGEGIAKIQHTTGGARLRMIDSIPFTLFANGIVMFSGPFRPYSDPQTQHLMKDLLDGYFPSELESRYPEGVPFQVDDKRSVYFREKHFPDTFAGSGQVLGGDTKPSRLVPSNLNKYSQSDPENDMEETSVIPGRKITVDQFLNKLPKSVMKAGKVIDIRTSVGDNLKGGSNTTVPATVIDTKVVQDMKKRLEHDGDRRPPTPRDTTTLRIKAESGEHTYIVKMRFNETIGDLRKYLRKNRPLGSQLFQILSSFPKKVFDSDHRTLEECGLTPNAALHLRAKKS